MKKLLLFISLLGFAFSSECLFATEQADLQRISNIITKAPYSDKKFAIDDFANFPINALIYGGMHTCIGVFQEGSQYIAYYSGYDGHTNSEAKYSFHKTKDEAILAAINLHPAFKHTYKQQLVARLLKQAESTKLDTPTNPAGWLQKFSNLSTKSKSMLALGAIVCAYIGSYQLSNYFSSK